MGKKVSDLDRKIFCAHFWTGNPLTCSKCGKAYRKSREEHYP